MAARRAGDKLIRLEAHFRQRRVGLGLTLRRFCLEAGLDPGSDESLEFFDLAAAENGKLPSDLLDNDELMDKLPVLFRAIRGQQVTAEKLEALIEFIRRGG